MEGKKKKNKKKKGNQAKPSDSISTIEAANQTKPDDSVSDADLVMPEQEHGYTPEMNNHNKAPSNAVYQRFEVSESDFEQERLKTLEANCEALQEQINKLEAEKNIWSKKEGTLEERIKHLQDEVCSCAQRELSLEVKIGDLQSINAMLTLREDGLEERIKKVEEMNLSFALEEVMELKESRDSLAQVNEHLTERISALESCIQHLDMVLEEIKSHQKAAEVSAKPDILNEEQPEKVSEIHVEPLQHSEIPDSEATVKHSSELQEKFLDSQITAKALQSLSVNGSDDFGSLNQLQQIQLLGLDDSRISEDVVSVPLDDIIQELQPAEAKPDIEPTVPISDAPLIGAPFRLISFVTRYVSGADLVDRPKLVN